MPVEIPAEIPAEMPLASPVMLPPPEETFSARDLLLDSVLQHAISQEYATSIRRRTKIGLSILDATEGEVSRPGQCI